MFRLGLRDGAMRQRALQHNPRCVVAYRWEPLDVLSEDWVPIGWATLTRKGQWRSGYPYLQTYVAPVHRGRGVGKKLVRAILDAARAWSKPVMIFENNKGAAKFYTKVL